LKRDRIIDHAPEPGRGPNLIRPQAVVELRHEALEYFERSRDEAGQTLTYDPLGTPSPLERDAALTRERMEAWFTGEGPQDFGATARLLSDCYTLLCGFLGSSVEARAWCSSDAEMADGMLGQAMRELLEGVGRVDTWLELAGRLAERIGPGDAVRTLAGGAILAKAMVDDPSNVGELEDALEMARDRARMWPPIGSTVEMDLWRSAAGKLTRWLGEASVAAADAAREGPDA
jgi:hypothetical protein